MNSECGNDVYESPGSVASERQVYMGKLQKWVEDAQKHNEMTFGLWCTVASQCNQMLSNANITVSTRNAHTPMAVNQTGVYMYVIPPFWKRILAEIIDFLILFVIKMFLTIIILESFDIVDLDNYHLNTFHKKLQNPKLAMQMSMEILFLELLHRFIVCCYETYWLVVQCATPGKQYMGLSVVYVVSVNHVEGYVDETVLAYPCTSLSIKDALFRALLKNVLIGLLLPVCFVLLFFKFNRTGYDLVTNSLVVEYNSNPPVQEHR